MMMSLVLTHESCQHLVCGGHYYDGTLTDDEVPTAVVSHRTFDHGDTSPTIHNLQSASITATITPKEA